MTDCHAALPLWHMASASAVLCFFFFNDTATTEIYTLSLHDALPISAAWSSPCICPYSSSDKPFSRRDRKSTRLNSSHANISYAVFCLKKKRRKCTVRGGACAAGRSGGALVPRGSA